MNMYLLYMSARGDMPKRLYFSILPQCTMQVVYSFPYMLLVLLKNVLLIKSPSSSLKQKGLRQDYGSSPMSPTSHDMGLSNHISTTLVKPEPGGGDMTASPRKKPRKQKKKKEEKEEEPEEEKQGIGKKLMKLLI